METADNNKNKQPGFFSSLKAAWQNRSQLGDKKLSVTQRQFLPAALEVQETPPSPAGRWLSFSLMALFTIGILWACFGKVDIVVTAPGRIIPSGQVKMIQPLETGTVKQIHVKEGDRVQKGQALISLDPTYAEADNQRISQQIADLALQASWREALEYWFNSNQQNETPLVLPANANPAKQAKAKQLYRQQRDEILARLNGMDKEQAAAEAEHAIADENLGWVFPMRISLAKDIINVENKTVKLSPGMSITAEVKTGKRRLIEFFLSPLLRYKQESVRER